MQISLKNTGKRFGRTWLFRDLSFRFEEGSKTAIKGPNGSGKSSLLQMISGYLSPTVGKVEFEEDNTRIPVEKWYKSLTIATPYMELLEEFSMKEQYDFHRNFKKPYQHSGFGEFSDICELSAHKHKEISNFSSGMKQRLRLAFALLFKSELILLDEPCSHLDLKAYEWYDQMISKYTNNRILIISSNDERETQSCRDKILITNFKKKRKKGD